MRSRAVGGAITLTTAILAASTTAHARPDGVVADRGTVVVAVGATTWAARSLAHDVYREADLLAPIDDAAARVLVGEPVPEGDERLANLAALRAALVPKDGEVHDARDPVGRRLLAGLGAEVHARVVVAVEMEGDAPVARIVRVADAQSVGDALAGDASDAAAGVRWPGAVIAIRAALPAAEPPAAPTRPPAAKPTSARSTPAASAPRKVPAAPKPSSIWASPWFWVGLGAVVATGTGVFLIGRAAEDDVSVVHGQGRVAQ